jgi:hypothetical protein
MSRSIEIKNNHDEKVGEIIFDDDPLNLNVWRTASGFRMSLPGKLMLVVLGQNDPVPLITNLRGQLFTSNSSGTATEIGEVQCESWYSGGRSSKPGGSAPHGIAMSWQGSLTQLAVIEKLREGRKLELQIQLRGELCYLLSSDHPRYQVRTHPQLIYGEVTLSYPKETWVRELQKIGVLENVLVEIPLPHSPPAPWDGVWLNLIKAREAFENGGSTGWNGCVLSVRQALEKWKEIEGEDTGPSDPRQRSKQERLNNLRRALHECAHVWIHGRDECSRNEALLMLSTLSGLLAERKP